MSALGAFAAATTTIGLGTLVLNNDMRNPVQLAWEVASIDALSGGRFELGLGRTLEDGHRHAVDWRTTRLDRQGALETICERVEGLTMADAETTPYLLVGSVEEIVLHMLTCNERWGINYFAVRELDDFEPILEALGR